MAEWNTNSDKACVYNAHDNAKYAGKIVLGTTYHRRQVSVWQSAHTVTAIDKLLYGTICCNVEQTSTLTCKTSLVLGPRTMHPVPALSNPPQAEIAINYHTKHTRYLLISKAQNKLARPLYLLRQNFGFYRDYLVANERWKLSARFLQGSTLDKNLALSFQLSFEMQYQVHRVIGARENTRASQRWSNPDSILTKL